MTGRSFLKTMKTKYLNPQSALKEKFLEQANRDCDEKGYVPNPQDNLISGVSMRDFEADLLEGDGNELRMKFCAIHSSAALAVNTFAFFKSFPTAFWLWGLQGLEELKFERKFSIFDEQSEHKSKANLDVFIKRNSDFIAVESKLLEYFSAKEAKFKPAYTEKNLSLAEPCWIDVMKKSRELGRQNLDVAQLVKHYFGLRRFQVTQQIQPKNITLLYLYWEPINADDHPICKRHRKEIDALREAVKSSEIIFKSMSYRELWGEWNHSDFLQTHVENLKKRYAVEL